MSQDDSIAGKGASSARMDDRAASADGTDERLAGVARGGAVLPALHWRFCFNLALTLCDAAMFMIAGATVLNVRHETQQLYSLRFGFDFGAIPYLIVLACFWVWSLRTVGIYHRHVMGDGYQVNALLVQGAVVCWTIQCAFDYLLDFKITLTSACLMMLSGLLLTMAERVVSRALIVRNRRKGEYAYGTVIVGSPHGIGRMLQFLSRRQQLNYRPVAVCPIRLNPETNLIEPDRDDEAMRRQIDDNWGWPLPVLEYDDYSLGRRIVGMDAQTVMVTDELRRYSDNYDIFSSRMESLGLEMAMTASAADPSNHEIHVRSIQGTTIITQCMPQYTAGRRLVKRVFDLVISTLAIICSLIITIPVAIAIKLTDGGPVFYRQTRIGLRGKTFKMIKFRSMVVNADALKKELAEKTGQADRFIFKMKDDPRITKVGHFIRRFSIDELPQFLNVWMGDMSVVGPRPPLPEEYERYNKLYATRMLVKPGITGPWQVSGRSDLSAEESEALDVAYVQDWSIMGDIVILLRTVGAVLSHKGAY